LGRSQDVVLREVVVVLVVAEDREGVERGKGWMVRRGSICVENESIEEGDNWGFRWTMRSY